MFSKIADHRGRTAAWRISLWSSAAFAIGRAVAFLFLQQFLANELQNGADSWLTGELGVLADVAERTPADRLHDRVVGEVAELASREVPTDGSGGRPSLDRTVFFLQIAADGTPKLHTGAASAESILPILAASHVAPQLPAYVRLPGFRVPFRVTEATLQNGDRIYLALSSQHERKVLRRLRLEFAVLWVTIIGLGTLIVYVSTRRMLSRVEKITVTAETIGRENLSQRVPNAAANDEISRLSLTLTVCWIG